MAENLYLSFVNEFLKEKEYVIILCLKELKIVNELVDPLYEIGIIILYQTYKLIKMNKLEIKNLDYFIYQVILEYMTSLFPKRTHIIQKL